MRSWSIRWLFPLQGRRVFSAPAWLVIAPFAVLAIGGYDLASGPDEVSRGVAIAVAVQLAVGVGFLVAGALERLARSDAAHIAVVVCAFLALAVGRPALVIALQEATGGELFAGQPFWVRVLTNLATIAIPTLLVFLLAQIIRHCLSVRERLDEIAASRAQQTACDEAAAERLADRLRAEAIEPVLRALDAARVEPFDAAEQAEALRRVAHDVVRPLSHAAGGIRAGEGEPVETAPPPGRDAPWAGLRMRHPPVWFAPVGLVLLTATAIITEYRALAGAIVVTALGVAVVLGLLARAIPVHRMPAAAGVAVVAVLQLAIGLAVSTILLLPASTLARPVFWITTPLAFAALGVVAGLILAVLDRLAEQERALSRLVAEAERRATAADANLRDLADRVARVMHTEVQGRIVATSLRMRIGAARPALLDELRAAVEADLRAAIEPAEAAEASAPELLARTIETWSAAAVPVEADAEPAAWEWIAAVPERARLVLDAVSEALTNAVRHGDDGAVRIELGRTDDGVRLVVRSPGRLRRGDDGIGLRSLVERGAVVSLDAEPPASVVLTVDVGSEVGAALV